MTDEIFECRDPNGVPFAETNNYVDRRWAMKTIAEKDTRIAELEVALKPFAVKDTEVTPEGQYYDMLVKHEDRVRASAVLSSNFPKTPAEWWARGEIESLRAHIAELEKALEPLAFREEIELTPENDAYPVKAIVVFKDEREAALKLLKGTKE
jgi:hypothetical protein